MELKSHQEECIENISDNFIHNKKGLIKMFCGSGKSLIIYHSLLKYGKTLGVVVVPSINLVTQFNNDYILNPLTIEFNNKYFNKKFNVLSVCSKDEIEKKEDANLVTTDKYIINKFINSTNEKIILITYQSLPNLIDIVKDNNIRIDLLCFDEAHHILGENIREILFTKKNRNKTINDNDTNFIDSYADKTLFFTATPKNIKNYKMYNNLTEINVGNINYEIIDNEIIDNEIIDNENIDDTDDTPICGPIIYEYSHLCGVSDDVLNDFNIRIELYSENAKSSVFETISRAILETGNNRILTFHGRSSKKSDRSSDVVSFSSKENQKLFKSAFNKILINEFPELTNKYKNIFLEGITAKTKNKSDILNSFDNTNDNDIHVLSSCKTIGEGVDTKNANMVCFIDPKQSYIEIIQNIGRICRKNKNTNKLSTVLIPSYVNIDKYNECDNIEMIDNVIRNEISCVGDFNGILSTLSALRQEDPYMFELCLKYPNTYTNEEFKRQFKRFNLILDDTEYTIEDLFNTYNLQYNDTHSTRDNFNQLSDDLNKNIKIFCKKIDEKNIRINDKYNTDECFVKTENDMYIKVLGKKERNTNVTRPNRNIKPFVHADDKIKVLWGLNNVSELDLNKKVFGCFIKSTVIANTKELWLEMFNNIMNDNAENMHKYSSWISKNKQKYKHKIGLLNNPEIKKLWEIIKDDKIKGKFFFSKEEIWYMKLEDYKTYFLSDEYKNDKENNTGSGKYQQMSEWVDRNVKNYRNNKTLMLNEDINYIWKCFMYDPIYYDIFKSYIYTSKYNIEKWKNKLNLVVNFKKILNKVNISNKSCYDINLSDDEKNAFWLLTFRSEWIEKNNNLFITKEEIMESDEVYNLWHDFTDNNSLNTNHVEKYTDISNNINNSNNVTNNKAEWLKKYNEFINWLDNQSERKTVNDFKIYASYIYIQNIMVYRNDNADKYKIDKWLEILANDKYKKFCIGLEDNFYFNINIIKKHYNKEIILTNEEIKWLNNWELQCMRKYKQKCEEMSNEKIRTDYSIFSIQYKNIDKYSAYRYEKCGQKKLEKTLNK